ncbi:MAG: hypothetical protein HOE53_01810 [Candidatus Magasanikbacteria bacterium]|nr:hypothetical protein [Candidatus Magasanikbacteria bacterium]
MNYALTRAGLFAATLVVGLTLFSNKLWIESDNLFWILTGLLFFLATWWLVVTNKLSKEKKALREQAREEFNDMRNSMFQFMCQTTKVTVKCNSDKLTLRIRPNRFNGSWHFSHSNENWTTLTPKDAQEIFMEMPWEHVTIEDRHFRRIVQNGRFIPYPPNS